MASSPQQGWNQKLPPYPRRASERATTGVRLHPGVHQPPRSQIGFKRSHNTWWKPSLTLTSHVALLPCQTLPFTLGKGRSQFRKLTSSWISLSSSPTLTDPVSDSHRVTVLVLVMFVYLGFPTFTCQDHDHALPSPMLGENAALSLMLVGEKPTLNGSSVHCWWEGCACAFSFLLLF